MSRFVRIKNAKNITFDTKTNTYYFEQQIDGKRKQWSTGVKGQVEIIQEKNKNYAIPKKGISKAKLVVYEFQSKLRPNKLDRAKFVDAFDLALKVQSSKSKRTFIVAKDGDKNLRTFFTKEVPYLDNFIGNYENYWSEYILFKKRENPNRKLDHDRRYLIFVLKRALKKDLISKDFNKSDFPLNEVTHPIGKGLEDEEVRRLLTSAKENNYDVLYLQILMAVTMGMRKGEILSLKIFHIDLEKKEIDLDPNNLKIRRKRSVEIPIADSVFDDLKNHVNRIKMTMPTNAPGFLFPKKFTNISGTPINWFEHQESLSTFSRLKVLSQVKCRFHDLRHTAITNMVRKRIPITTISKVCGVGIELINRIYDHVNTDSKKEIRELFNGRFTKDL